MKPVFFLLIASLLVALAVSGQLVNGKQAGYSSGIDTVNVVRVLHAEAQVQIKARKFDQATAYALDALKMATSINYCPGIAEANLILGACYQQTGLESPLAYYSHALELFESCGTPAQIARTLTSLGVYYGRIHHYEEATGYLDRSLAVKDQYGLEKEKIASYMGYGSINQVQGFYEKAQTCYLKAAGIADSLKDTVALGRAYYELSTSYDKQGDFGNTIKYNLLAKKLFDAAKDPLGMAQTNYGLGVCYMQMGEYHQSLRYHFKALEYHRSTNNMHSVATSLNQIGSVYTFLGDYSAADQYLKEALEIAGKWNSAKLTASCHDNLGLNFLHQSLYNDAFFHFNKALAGFLGIGERYHTSKTLSNIASILNTKGQSGEALDTLYRCLRFARQAKAKENIQRAYDGLAVSHFALHNLDSAYYYSRLYGVMKDSVLDEMSAKQVIAYQQLYDSERKDNEIAVLNLENEHHRNQLLLAANAKRILELGLQSEKQQTDLVSSENQRARQSLLLAENIQQLQRDSITHLSLVNILNAQQAESERNRIRWAATSGVGFLALVSAMLYQFFRRREARNSLAINHLRNKVLRSQLNPHFIFNALNSIRNFIEHHPEVADSYLIRFSHLMRQVLENSEEERIALKEEIAMLDNYMRLETLRLPHGFDFEISMAENVDPANTLVPPLIMQPIIENAIWHGLRPLNRKGKIHIHFREHAGLLEASIQDDGAGLNAAKVNVISVEKKRSMGVQITRERLALINRKARMKGSLVQQLLEQGAIVRMAIPVSS